MYKVSSASAQPNLLISQIKRTTVYLPPMNKQNEFGDFVKATDKSKIAIQKSLDDLETLKKSLMQQYLG